MSKPVITVLNLSKTFKLPHEKNNSIKSALISSWRKKRTFEVQQALDDISFEINKGEFFGIVGRNGSGKSTLLKLIAGIYTPTSGTVTVNGKLTPFIELGVGFNPELTGRENVFLNGALLGFDRKEIAERYPEIVKFAELERFMDQKLKNYSSGMQVRLAFSIAIQAQSDVLVLDEVLAVGDEAFQEKCIDIFEKYQAKKQTIVLVTHNMEMVKRFCTRAVLIDNGKIRAIGEPREIAREYSEMNNEAIAEALDTEKNEPSDIELSISGTKGGSKNSFEVNENMIVDMKWSSKLKGVKNAGIAIVRNNGEVVFGANTFKEDMTPKGAAKYKVKLALGPGKYFLIAGVFGSVEHDVISFLDQGPYFVINKDEDTGAQGLTRLAYEWLSPDTSS